jgi:hypothetical protein
MQEIELQAKCVISKALVFLVSHEDEESVWGKRSVLGLCSLLLLHRGKRGVPAGAVFLRHIML